MSECVEEAKKRIYVASDSSASYTWYLRSGSGRSELEGGQRVEQRHGVLWKRLGWEC